MHSGHLGVFPIVIGGAFEELASGYEGNSAEQAAALWNDVQRKHRELGLQKLVYTLTGSMYRGSTTEYARLRHVRAAEAVSLLPVSTALCREVNNGSEHDVHRLLVLEALERCEALLRTAGCELFFDKATAAALEAAGESILLHLSALSHMCMVEGILRYPVTVKAHALWHLCCRTFSLNPRAVWCYVIEDFMGRVVQCASRSVAGTATQGIGRKVDENYRLVAALRFGRSK
jgi:hypothetical protein